MGRVTLRFSFRADPREMPGYSRSPLFVAAGGPAKVAPFAIRRARGDIGGVTGGRPPGDNSGLRGVAPREVTAGYGGFVPPGR
jgi:hypothetical protein